ncbi:MAG: hypothetical protein PHG51_06445, partial [Candidatus Omnitrophica bacterium]|nr:hypothetical protein [Candidatus Omnitrophota bacterium]
PWFTIQKTCRLIGISYRSSAMAFYVKKKWLHPVKKPIEGGNHWTWLFFKSDIDAFLMDDPRAKRALWLGRTKKQNNLAAGKAVLALRVWILQCPICNKRVRIYVHPRITGAEVKKLFIKKYNISGKCSHKSVCFIKKELKPYVIRKSAFLESKQDIKYTSGGWKD